MDVAPMGSYAPINNAACICIPQSTSDYELLESNIFSNFGHILHISFPHNCRESMGPIYKVEEVRLSSIEKFAIPCHSRPFDKIRGSRLSL
jgi:hypothetical protein